MATTQAAVALIQMQGPDHAVTQHSVPSRPVQNHFVSKRGFISWMVTYCSNSPREVYGPLGAQNHDRWPMSSKLVIMIIWKCSLPVLTFALMMFHIATDLEEIATRAVLVWYQRTYTIIWKHSWNTVDPWITWDRTVQVHFIHGFFSINVLGNFGEICNNLRKLADDLCSLEILGND